jgi:hypothetical protein
VGLGLGRWATGPVSLASQVHITSQGNENVRSGAEGLENLTVILRNIRGIIVGFACMGFLGRQEGVMEFVVGFIVAE